MNKKSLFTSEEREAKLDKLSAVLQLQDAQADFAAGASEAIFTAIRQMGGNGLCSIGLARANLQLHWKAAVCNLRRLCCPADCETAAC